MIRNKLQIKIKLTQNVYYIFKINVPTVYQVRRIKYAVPKYTIFKCILNMYLRFKMYLSNFT